MYVNEVIMKYF